MTELEKILSITDEEEQHKYLVENIHSYDELEKYIYEAIPGHFETFKNGTTLYYPDGMTFKVIGSKKKRHKINYINVPAAFDIETTNIYYKGEKCAYMYIWQFALNGYVFIGRTPDQLKQFLKKLHDLLNLNDNLLLPVIIHNLSFEFQFLRKYIHEALFPNEWCVFATKKYQPIRATIAGIEFRDSLILSGTSLDHLSDELTHKNIHKMTGKFDYNKIRHYTTNMTDKELLYCIYDVIVLNTYIYEKLQSGETYDKMPMTKTGYVRNHVRENTIKRSDSRYKFIIENLTIKPQEYIHMRRCFMGGFTHSNANHTGITLENVHSYDISSSYPTALISEKYPMSSGVRVKPNKKGNECLEDLDKIVSKDKCYIAIVELTDVRPKYDFQNDFYISESKCFVKEGVKSTNGRLYKADKIQLYVTNIDLDIIRKCYNFNFNLVGDNILCYNLEYLPKELIECVLDLYEQKTTLKGLTSEDGSIERKYGYYKALLNSLYGCMVQKIDNDINEYCSLTDEWNETRSEDIESALEKYNENKGRFNFYCWGLFCTCYARSNLWKGIFELKDDYIYSDTDSLKYLNFEKHEKFFEDYNKEITNKIDTVLKHYNIEPERSRPKNVKGKKCQIGIFDYEGKYDRFKTWGAKRYMTEEDGNIHITIAGLGKEAGAKYISKQKIDPFDFFSESMTVPASETGKLTHFYGDKEFKGEIVDYEGNEGYFETKSFVHLEPTSFSMSVMEDYKQIMLNINHFSI